MVRDVDWEKSNKTYETRQHSNPYKCTVGYAQQNDLKAQHQRTQELKYIHDHK